MAKAIIEATGWTAVDPANPPALHMVALYNDGSGAVPLTKFDGHCDDEPDVYRVGKKRAGNRLDGVQHLAFPTTAAGARP